MNVKTLYNHNLLEKLPPPSAFISLVIISSFSFVLISFNVMDVFLFIFFHHRIVYFLNCDQFQIRLDFSFLCFASELMNCYICKKAGPVCKTVIMTSIQWNPVITTSVYATPRL